MSEERPVPRRESPWGLPEGDNRQPKAHRCNDRAEDVVQACFEGNPFKTVPGPFKLFWQCMRSKPGSSSLSTNVIDKGEGNYLLEGQILSMLLQSARDEGGTNRTIYIPAAGSSKEGGSQARVNST